MVDLIPTTAGEFVPGPGFYRMEAAAYHADPAPAPSLSSSLAAELIEKTPRHAWYQHPRLNTEPEEQADNPTRAAEIGTAAHAILLGHGPRVVVIHGDDYRTKDAKEARAAAYDAGEAPILSVDHTKVERMVAAARLQMAEDAISEEFFAGISEPVLIWKDHAGPWCRVMMDRLFIGPSRAIIFDLKCSSSSVAPDGLGRKIVDMGYETRAAFYERGLISLRPDLAGRIQYIHLWLEMDAPYALLPAALDGAALMIGRKKAAAAIGLWQKCMTSGVWPLYPAGVCTPDYPIYAENSWINRETLDEEIHDIINRDPFLNFTELNAPVAPKRLMEPV